MKKALALLLALVMVFALCACGNSTAPAADPTEAPAEATPEATEAPVVSEETAAVLSKWTDDLYEPETSITYSATIVWPADASAVETAAKDVRPNTMIVAVDENLTVSTWMVKSSPRTSLSTSPPSSRPPCPHCTSVTMRPQPRSTPSLPSTLWPTPSLLPTTSTLSMLRTSAMQTSAFSVSSTGVKPSSAPSAATC